MITILLLIITSSIAIKKKNNIALGVVIVGNLIVYYFTQSPILCWIVSIACIIWASSQDKKASAAIVTAQTNHISTQKISSKEKLEKEEEAEEEPVFEKKIKCRFCKKSYSSEYNGCPYCKKK